MTIDQSQMENKSPYIAASSYLNAAPLCYSFVYGEQVDRCTFLSDAAPARCSELLAEGRADAALIPVIEYQRINGLKIVPGACVASKKTVVRCAGRLVPHLCCADTDNPGTVL
jgi:chorismate dehydratase